MSNADEFYLNLCLQNAWQNQLLTLKNPAVGALVLDKYGAILSIESHQECGKPHAEVLALQKAYAKLSGDSAILSLRDSNQIHHYLRTYAKGFFCDSTIYVSLEPCASKKNGQTPSCAELLKFLKPKRIVIAAQDIDPKAKGGAKELELYGIPIIKAWEVTNLQSINQSANHLLIPFMSLQSKKRFLLFKYACRLDGSINGGQISSKSAQIQMHNYRSKADYLLISGKSVRLDQPILDTRFATLESKHTPDVLILTREQNFPHNAPLFNVPCRNVEILHHLDFLQPYDLNLESQKLGFIFCEGGAELLNTLSPYIDMLLVILNPSFYANATLTMRLNQSFYLIHSMQIGEDLFLWLVPKYQETSLNPSLHDIPVSKESLQ